MKICKDKKETFGSTLLYLFSPFGSQQPEANRTHFTRYYNTTDKGGVLWHGGFLFQKVIQSALTRTPK